MSQTLHILTGPPAAGKTTLGVVLSKKIGAVFLDIDLATEPVVKAAMSALTGDPDDRDSNTFKTNFREPIYETLFTIAASNLQNLDVVLTGPFTKEYQDSNWLDKVSQRLPKGTAVRAYWVHCDSQTRRSRAAARANPRDTAKLADWAAHQAYYEKMAAPLFPHIPIDTSADPNLESLVAKLLD